MSYTFKVGDRVYYDRPMIEREHSSILPGALGTVFNVGPTVISVNWDEDAINQNSSLPKPYEDYFDGFTYRNVWRVPKGDLLLLKDLSLSLVTQRRTLTKLDRISIKIRQMEARRKAQGYAF